MDQKLNHQPRLTMRVAKGSLIFTMPDGSSATQIAYDRYVPKSGMSLPANLREAYKTEELLQRPTKKAQVLVDSNALLIPIEEYHEDDNDTLYYHSFPETEGCVVVSNVLAQLNAVALFAVNRDLKALWLTTIIPMCAIRCSCGPCGTTCASAVWWVTAARLYAYYHDSVLGCSASSATASSSPTVMRRAMPRT